MRDLRAILTHEALGTWMGDYSILIDVTAYNATIIHAKGFFVDEVLDLAALSMRKQVIPETKRSAIFLYSTVQSCEILTT